MFFARTGKALLAALTGVITVFFGTWMFLYAKAQSRPIPPPFPHPFQSFHQIDRPIIYYQPAKVSKAELDFFLQVSAAAQHPSGLWIDLRLGGDNVIYVSENEFISVKDVPVPVPIEVATAEQLAQSNLLTLTQAFEQVKMLNRPLILNLISRKPGIDQALMTTWGPGNKAISSQNVLIQSDARGLIKSLRESNPQGFFGSSTATLLQLEILDHMGLANLLDLQSDVLIEKDRNFNDGKINPNSQLKVRPEIRRIAIERNLKYYIGSFADEGSIQKSLDLKPDGIIVTNAQLWQSILLKK